MQTKKSLNILILNWRDPKNPLAGGAERVTYEHAQGWVKAGHTVTWYTSFFKGTKHEEIIDKIKYIRWGNHLSVYLLAPFYILHKSSEFDLVIDEVHGFPFFTPLYTRKPIIVFIHEVAGEIWDYMYPFPINYLGRIIESLYLKVYRKFTFWTDANTTADELNAQGIDRKMITVIPCALNNPPKPKYPKENNPTYIFVGRIVKMKGIEDVIKAFELISKKQLDAKLWIVGSGDERYVNIIKQMVNRLGISNHVIFWDYVEENKKFELMNRAHLLLHASIKEGWGLVVAEAASQGTPAVVYPSGALKEIVQYKKTGICISTNSYELLANEAMKLLKDKKTYKMYSNACITYAKNLNWSKPLKMSNKLILCKTT